MSKQDEASLILKLYELRRDDTLRKARDWYFSQFNPESMADYNAALFAPTADFCAWLSATGKWRPLW